MKCKYVKVTYQVNDKVTKCFLRVNICDNGEVWERKTYVGKTICSNDDKFDFEIGKRIALAKAELKLYNWIGKHTTKVIKSINEDLKEFENFRDFAIKQVKHNEEYLKEERYLNYKKK